MPLSNWSYTKPSLAVVSRSRTTTFLLCGGGKSTLALKFLCNVPLQVQKFLVKNFDDAGLLRLHKCYANIDSARSA